MFPKGYQIGFSLPLPAGSSSSIPVKAEYYLQGNHVQNQAQCTHPSHNRPYLTAVLHPGKMQASNGNIEISSNWPHILLQFCKSCLCLRQVSRLERLTERAEISGKLVLASPNY
jgi:hypothetical protein